MARKKLLSSIDANAYVDCAGPKFSIVVPLFRTCLLYTSLSLNRGIREPFFERRKDEHVKCAENCRNIVANPEQPYMIADSKGGDSGTDVRLVFAASHEHELC